MTTEKQTITHSSLKLPSRLFLFSLTVGLLTPFIARLPSVPVRGWGWFTDYFLGLWGLLFFSAFNLIPTCVLYAIGKGSKKAPLAYWFSIAGGGSFLLWAHGSVDLSSSSTASIALLFIPIYDVLAILAGLVMGLLIHAIVKVERMRVWATWIVMIAAVVFGAGIAVHESRAVVTRESRFPFIAVSDIPLEKRHVYGHDFMGRVEVLAFGDFDNISGNDIVALGDSRIKTLQPVSYEVRSTSEFNQEDCDGCVHMYPYLAPDGKGSILISTSNGVSDINGHLLWVWKSSGFSRVVPISFLEQQPNFFAYQGSDYVVLHDKDGKVLWSKKLPVSDVGRYETTEGEQLPFAISCYGESSELKIFSQEGEMHQTIKLPDWASNIEGVAWPSRGHLLVGSGSWLGVLDMHGQEILKHYIKDTSFDPYHGPNGTSIKFSATENPYLAVLSHGSSGYPRSVLLIFNPKGNLVWQEELKKLSTIIAVPNEDRSSEVLLVGGIDGIIEYKMSNLTESN